MHIKSNIKYDYSLTTSTLEFKPRERKLTHNDPSTRSLPFLRELLF